MSVISITKRDLKLLKKVRGNDYARFVEQYGCLPGRCYICGRVKPREDFQQIDKLGRRNSAPSCNDCREIRERAQKERQEQKCREQGRTRYISPRLRFQILGRDKFTCRYCGRSAPSVILHVDHRFPFSKGGANDLTNLVTSCSECNFGKGQSVLGEHNTCEVD